MEEDELFQLPPSEPHPIHKLNVDLDKNRKLSKPTFTQIEEPKSGCCSKFFAARALTSKQDRESYIRCTVIELLIYLVFLTNLCIIAFGMTSSHAYYFTKVINDLIIEAPFGNTNFRTSSRAEHFWGFTERVMIKAMYTERWYDDPDELLKILPKDQGILYENRLLGVPRLRQKRVKKEFCPAPKNLHRIARHCYQSYSEEAEEKENYAEHEITHPQAWIYHSTDQLKGSSHWGLLGTYSGAGAFQDLGVTKEDTLAVIENLKDKLWINRGTRVIFLDFTLYNANINLFCAVKLVWEFPATGGVLTSWTIRTVRLIRYISNFDYFIFGCEILFCLYTLYYFIQEIMEFCRLGFTKYFKDIWSYLDIVILMISFFCIGFSIYRYDSVQNTLGDILNDPSGFADFEFLGFWETEFQYGVSLCVFFSWVKIFKYISFNKTMNQLSSTLSRCATDIAGFAIMFFIVFFAFCQLGYLAFGSQVASFSTFEASIFTLLRLIVGEFDFEEIQRANKVLAPIFFLAYVFFVFFVLLNMFLAIINDTYSQVKAEIQSQRNEFEITDYIKQGFNKLFGLCGCRNQKVDVENAVKLAAGDPQITYSELKNNLLSAKFSDLEVEMFLARYECNEKRILDKDGSQHMLSSLGGSDLVHKNTNIGATRRKSLSKKRPDPTVDIALTQEEVAHMQRRVGTLESSLSDIGHKLESIIKKLEFHHYNDLSTEHRRSNTTN